MCHLKRLQGSVVFSHFTENWGTDKIKKREDGKKAWMWWKRSCRKDKIIAKHRSHSEKKWLMPQQWKDFRHHQGCHSGVVPIWSRCTDGLQHNYLHKDQGKTADYSTTLKLQPILNIFAFYCHFDKTIPDPIHFVPGGPLNELESLYWLTGTALLTRSG